MFFAHKIRSFRSMRVKFEMAVLKQRKIDGERRVFRDKLTDQYYFKAQKRNSCVFSLLGKKHRVHGQSIVNSKNTRQWFMVSLYN